MKFTQAICFTLLQASGLTASIVNTGQAGSPLVQRDCWFGKTSGCTNGYCWKTCDKSSGTWIKEAAPAVAIGLSALAIVTAARASQCIEVAALTTLPRPITATIVAAAVTRPGRKRGSGL
ncbi:hypothetical protein O1611_g1763 [Lasiodiplodia mahajangana]|uniref:Uncharacterized protein n=1 Tax=Lasiodiplodia mahajangana TaxID=1108764 RepID=A0ACC2JX28_9PEZI|nr:hypothetical protein O1611_g1763 [Lasiodiplodia mahajangana]